MKRTLALAGGLVVATLLDSTMAQPPSPLLAVDQHRATVVERIVNEWSDGVVLDGARLTREQLRELLQAMRADQLLAASLAGSAEGLRGVLAGSPAAAAKPGLPQAKIFGDLGDDVVYTPVAPCRLVDTRGSFAAVYQGGGAFSGGTVRNYTIQTANGVCTSQLQVGLNPAAVQIQVFGIPINGSASGDIEILPQGSTFGATATAVYVGNVAFNTASTSARINPANNQIGVQVRGGGAHVAIDVVGYFRRASNYGGTHIVTGIYATDSGGVNQAADGDYSTIGGGQGNSTTTFGSGSTVSGGAFNFADGAAATVSGGRSNTVLNNHGTVAGGHLNLASGDSGTVAGGYDNVASGDYSTVAGGYGNIASGTGTFASGSYANANTDGCFVFGDNSTTNAVSCGHAHNQFVVRAVGGVYLLTGGTSDATYTGAALAPGATAWTVYSDRSGKENVAPIDPIAVLHKVAALSLNTWNWKSQDTSIRHMGPMAQDFRAAFGLGETETGISTVDADGVALAAIQGLHQRAEQGDAQVLALEQRVTEVERLERRVSEVEALRGEIAALKALVASMLQAGRVSGGPSDSMPQVGRVIARQE